MATDRAARTQLELFAAACEDPYGPRCGPLWLDPAGGPAGDWTCLACRRAWSLPPLGRVDG